MRAGVKKANWKALINSSQHERFYFPLTTEELYDKGQNIKRIDEKKRVPMWIHMSGVTTLGQAASLLAYHLSEQDVGAKGMNGYQHPNQHHGFGMQQ